MPLAGEWSFRLDPQDVGETEEWYNHELPGKIQLPGSLQAQGFGNDVSASTKWTGGIKDRSWYTSPSYEKYRVSGNVKVPFWLQPDKHYVGPAWYQRTVAIPDNWRRKRITLHLERPHWKTTVWVNGKQLGSAASLSTPHVYELTEGLQSLSQRVTIRVDNRMSVDVGHNAHSVTDHTQSNWNGVVGRIELRATDRVWIDDVQVYPDVVNKLAKVRVTVGNLTKEGGDGVLNAAAQCDNVDDSHQVAEKEVPFTFDTGDRQTIEFDYPLGDGAQFWDEFHPALYRLTVKLGAGTREERLADERTVTFGIRHLTTSGTQFVLNGRPILLRGTLECAIFPRTGYPPTDVGAWKRIIRVCKAHGLNHIRFHSWCPPEAAFVAADEEGLYFQVEGPFWTTVGNNRPIDPYIKTECDQILKAYGNHPSFVLMAYGNEPGGKNQGRYLGELVDDWRRRDSRRLFTSASGWPQIAQNQYHVTPAPRIQQWGQGLRSRINALPPETVTDYRDVIGQWDVPVVSHEIGQWCVYPNFDEINKYTGVLKAKNFEVFRDLLEKNQMADQAHDFLMASGKLQVLCYKEEIESALRTPGFGGFQLLDLHDFPGQGTALVGVLDPFWDSKPYLSPAAFRRFCNVTVPLARMKKRIFTVGEVFAADVDVAHYAAEDKQDVTVRWVLRSASGQTVTTGSFERVPLVTGRPNRVGRIETKLDVVDAPQKMNLVVGVADTAIENDWDLWVYPRAIETEPSADVLVTSQLDDTALAKLKAGGSVMWLPPLEAVKSDVAIGFSPIFWNTAWTGGQPPHTLGILCDPEHPALAAFSTEYHTNWQWWELISRSAAMVLNDLPPELRPIVQTIDTWFKARRLGLVLEAKVAGGKLLVCSIDLASDLEQRPVARQLRHSLSNYMSGDEFNPQVELTVDQARSL